MPVNKALQALQAGVPEGQRRCKVCRVVQDTAVFGTFATYYVCQTCRGAPPHATGEENDPMELGPTPDFADEERFVPPAPLDVGASVVHASPMLLAHLRATGGVSEGAAVDLDVFLAQHAVVGAAGDRRWLAEVCLPHGSTAPVNLTVVRAYLQALFDERETLLKATWAQAKPAAPEDLAPESIPLETAALALYWACLPEMRERFDAACEQSGMPLNRVMMGAFAYHRDELHANDPTLVAEATHTQQFGTQGSRGLRPVPGRAMTEQGELLRTCKVCAVVFTPPKGRPHVDFCHNDCGGFHYALQTYHWNAVRYPDMTGAALPDPFLLLPQRREDPAAMAAAQAYIAGSREALQDLARAKLTSMGGVA
jgi:hypothetical protein